MSTAPAMSQPEKRTVEAKADAEADRLTWVNWMNLAAYVVNLVLIYVSITGVFGATNREMSQKYQTLVTPAGFAFSIWGLIFVWEGIFASAQMLSRFRGSPIVHAIAPLWWLTCACQVAWSLVFAQDWVIAALVLMLGILASLIGILSRANSITCSSALEFWLVRAPFSLHTGWIIAASILSVNVVADAARASPAVLLALAVVSLTVVVAVASLFTLAVPRPDAIIPFVAAWALFAISRELQEATILNEPTRHNPFAWDRMVLDALEMSTRILSLVCLGMAVVCVVLHTYRCGIITSFARTPESQEADSIVPQASTPGICEI